MADLTPERLAELRRIAEAATPGPWAWRMSKDGRILDLITLETGYNEEIITPSHINAWLQVKGGLKDFIPAFDPATALALLDRIEALQSMLLHLYQDTVVPGTGYCIRCGMIGGHDEWCAMAAVEELLGIEIEGNGEEEGGATDGR